MYFVKHGKYLSGGCMKCLTLALANKVATKTEARVIRQARDSLQLYLAKTKTPANNMTGHTINPNSAASRLQ